VRFEMTTAVRNQLRRMGFKPEQIEASRTPTSNRPLPPPGRRGDRAGKQLRTTDAERDQVLANIKKITKLSAADVQPCRHTHHALGGAGRAGGFFGRHQEAGNVSADQCKEPLRSGLDRRSAHVV